MVKYVCVIKLGRTAVANWLFPLAAFCPRKGSKKNFVSVQRVSFLSPLSRVKFDSCSTSCVCDRMESSWERAEKRPSPRVAPTHTLNKSKSKRACCFLNCATLILILIRNGAPPKPPAQRLFSWSNPEPLSNHQYFLCGWLDSLSIDLNLGFLIRLMREFTWTCFIATLKARLAHYCSHSLNLWGRVHVCVCMGVCVCAWGHA